MILNRDEYFNTSWRSKNSTQGVILTVKNLVVRHYKKETEPAVLPLFKELFQLILKQGEFVSGETFFNKDKPEDHVTISAWESMEKWACNTTRSFVHGVHPKDHKAATNTSPIVPLPLPDQVMVPLQQHIGRECDPIVGKKDEVKTGQIIAKTAGFITSPVHSPVTGIVKDVGHYMHYRGQRARMVVIQRSGEDDWHTLSTPQNWEQATIEELNARVYEAGIVGMGGAGFPSHVKFTVLPEKPIDSFILNGCECEPYLTCDHRIMIEKTDDVLLGMRIAMKMLGVSKGYIGIENNKKDAVRLIHKAIQNSGFPIQVVPLKVKYPQGAEKLLIKAALNRIVPAGGLPGDVGVIVNNPGTIHAVKEAVIDGKALISRTVTVTGDGINRPANLLVRVGTSIRDLVNFCGGIKSSCNLIIMGGPMMGFSQFDLSVPIVKTTSGIVFTSFQKESTVYPCIRCNSCVSACPMFLLPNRLSRLVEMERYDKTETLGISICNECGSCSYVCPSKIPILQWLKVGKSKLIERKKKSAV